MTGPGIYETQPLAVFLDDLRHCFERLLQVRRRHDRCQAHLCTYSKAESLHDSGDPGLILHVEDDEASAIAVVRKHVGCLGLQIGHELFKHSADLAAAYNLVTRIDGNLEPDHHPHDCALSSAGFTSASRAQYDGRPGLSIRVIAHTRLTAQGRTLCQDAEIGPCKLRVEE